MQEFIELQRKCLEALNTVLDCGQNCPNGDFCTKSGLSKGDCSQCLYNIHHGKPPSCSYNCQKITYQYTLRFFNRYASEIYHFLKLFLKLDGFNNITDFNVVSLGCGPGSEVFGIIKALQSSNSPATLHFAGYDIKSVWESVQEMSKQCLGQTQHDIQFYTEDLFTSKKFSDNNTIHLLILNYFLSDVVKFYPVDKSKNLVNNIKEFIIENNVQNILFNDINYYGYDGRYDSGVMLMNYLIQLLEKERKGLEKIYICFENDPHLGDERWKQHKANTIILQHLPENKYTANLPVCTSKQIFVHIQ